MRKRTIGIIVGTALIISVLGAAAGIFFKGTADARAFALKTVPEICRGWDEGVLRAYLNRDKFSDSDVKLIAKLGRQELGELKTFNVNRATLSPDQVGGESYMRFCYAIPATFEKADDIGLQFYIARIDGRWQLVNFDVTNPNERRNTLFKPAPASVFLPIKSGSTK